MPSKFNKIIPLSVLLMMGACGSESSQDDAPTIAERTPGEFAPEKIAEPVDYELLTLESKFARLALDCVARQYPNKISHVLASGEDVKSPQQLYPIFYGCFDWHSSVHGHWLLTRLWGNNSVPELDADIEALLDTSFTADNVAVERQYFLGNERDSFERPYGIAWYLQLMTELRDISKGSGAKAEKAKKLMEIMAPLEFVIIDKLKKWLPKLAYPVRIGTHNQTAFAFGLILDWERAGGDAGLGRLVRDKSLEFHSNDENCPIGYEPSGEDFLSPCLMEADLMRRILPQSEFSAWLSNFLPDIPVDGNDKWLEAGIVKDPSDGKLVHLDGVNISRAWALDGIASALPADDPRIASLRAAMKKHADVGLASVSEEHYSGSHWLASFGTYYLTRRGIKKLPKPVGTEQAVGKDEATEVTTPTKTDE